MDVNNSPIGHDFGNPENLIKMSFKKKKSTSKSRPLWLSAMLMVKVDES